MPSASRAATAAVFSLSILFACCSGAAAQQKKGDKEILFFSGGFFVAVDETKFKDSQLTGTGTLGYTRGFRSFNIGGQAGYFITPHSEIGAGTSVFVYHYRYCQRSFEDGRTLGESCESETSFSMSLNGFYRYYFAREGSKRLVFAGAEISAADLTRNYTGNIRVRPYIGYRHFLEKKVALDFSVGYLAELNKQSDSFFPRDREGSIVGQVSLSFIF